jgi:hypothetical protein
MPFCGIGADVAFGRLVAADVEETENHIHVPIKGKGDFDSESFKTVTLSDDEGIKAVMGKLKDDSDGSMVIQKYLFDKEKGWTVEKAKSWVKEHKDEALEVFKDTILKDLLPSGKMYDLVVRTLDVCSKVGDMSLEEIEKKISELKAKRDEIQMRLQKIYENRSESEEIDKLYVELNDVEMELRAYYEAKVTKIAQESDENVWVKAIDWKQNRAAFDKLPENMQVVITELGLCPDCSDEIVVDYDKAPEDKEWNLDRADYSPEQLSYASSVVVVGDTVHGFGFTGEDLTKADCKLPHHLPGDGKSHGGTLVWRGVAAAGAALAGARGASITGEAADKAKAHLVKHYEEFDKEAPWKKDDKDAWVLQESFDELTTQLIADAEKPVEKDEPTYPIPGTRELLSRPDLIG